MSASHRRAALAAIALVVLAGLAGSAVAQSGPTVRVGDASVDPGETTTVPVVLTASPDGLAGYELEVTVGPGASLVDASYPDAFGLTTAPAASDDGRTLRLEAADVNGQIEAGAGEVRLATVTVRGETAGRVDLTVEPVQFDADGGGAIEPATVDAAVLVGVTPTATPSLTATATATAAGDVPATADPGGPTVPMPGFGPVVALVAVAALATGAWARRR
jgi:hypothetical protein